MPIAIPQIVTEDRASGAPIIEGSLLLDEIDEDYLVNINFTIRLSNLNKIEPSVSRGWEKKISGYITSSFKTESGCCLLYTSDAADE